MAAIETTVELDGDPIYSEYGRLPKGTVIDNARYVLEARVKRDTEALERIKEWTTHTHRGSKDALSFEELQGAFHSVA